jgi:hypothetical protein
LSHPRSADRFSNSRKGHLRELIRRNTIGQHRLDGRQTCTDDHALIGADVVNAIHRRKNAAQSGEWSAARLLQL